MSSKLAELKALLGTRRNLHSVECECYHCELLKQVTDCVAALCAEFEALERGWKCKAPWSQQEVDTLNALQKSENVHPYTCGNDRKSAAHTDGEGVLVATVDGWICPFCDYKQNWCHESSIAFGLQRQLSERDATIVQLGMTIDNQSDNLMQLTDELSATKQQVERLTAERDDALLVIEQLRKDE